MKLKRKFETFQKEQQKAEEKTVCKEFNKFMKKTKTTVQKSSLVKHKIVICLFEKFITKSEKQ